ncbi:hypothetical protein SEA_ATUIN_92 [Arthrobacter phage Atuin]|nr:hypothetical protein SEA_ATUIN_191 [Arthrobacter phage Atuin]
MFVLLDSDPKNLVQVYDMLNEVDDKPILGIEDLEDYSPDGDFHLLDLVTEYEDPATQRWSEMVLASKGARLFSDTENKNSPLWAGKLPTSKTDYDKMIAGAKFADGRAAYFREFNVNYIGRTNLSPRNVILLDNKKGNAQHSPLIDESLAPLYSGMEEDWWGSCALVSTGNVDRLASFFDEFIDEVVPLGYTSGSHAKLKSFGVDFAKIPAPSDDPTWGRRVREIANRLSYNLSLQ